MENPFAPLRAHEHLFETTGVRDALARLADGSGAREPFVLVCGAPGTGKSALVRAAAARWGERACVAYPALPALAAGELLEEIVRRFGGEPPEGASRSKLAAELERTLAAIAARGQVAVVVVDDAHDLPAERLEELRLLVDAARRANPALEVVLAGLPALEERLDDPALAALRQRVSVRVRLEPFTPAETRHYLHHRIGAAGGDGPAWFARRTCREVAALAHGVPRRVDVLAHEALRLARAAGLAAVAPEHVQAAAVALWGGGALAAAAHVPAPDRETTPARTTTEPAAPKAHATVPERAPAAARMAPAVARPVATTSAPAAAAAAAAPPPATAAHERTKVTPPSRPAPSAKPAPMPAPPAAALADRAARGATDDAPHAIPATHDAREWVARFVGDRGPLQLSVRARPVSAGAPGPGDGSQAPDGAGATPSWASALAANAPVRTRPKRRMRDVVAPALAALVTVTVVLLAVHLTGLAHRPAATAAGAPAKDAKAPVAAAGTQAPEVRVVKRRAPSGAPAKPAETQPAPVAAPAPAAHEAASRYTIDVGGYVDFDRAMQERDRIQERTGIEAWVVPAPDGSSRLHRIVLGIFRSESRATSAADALLASESVREAVVIPLPGRRERR